MRRRLGRAIRAIANVVHSMTLGPVFRLASRLEGTDVYSCTQQPEPAEQLGTVPSSPAGPTETEHAERLITEMQLRDALARALGNRPSQEIH